MASGPLRVLRSLFVGQVRVDRLVTYFAELLFLHLHMERKMHSPAHASDRREDDAGKQGDALNTDCTICK